ncbi:MAG TPA: nitric oxide synthase oxygenase [Micromonosporaceae bacterium]
MSGVPGYRNIPIETWDAAAPTDPREAEEFLRLYHSEHPTAGALGIRLAAVRAEIAATGTYVHTGPELQFGARIAWRNASRCIGRLYWNSMLVLDRRASRTADRIFADVVTHLRIASGDSRVDLTSGAEVEGGGNGQLRPTISIFPPAVPGRPYARIWNDQLIRYAGYRHDDTVTGDPRYAEFTAAMTERGWRGKGEAFDVLPLAIETPTDGVRLFDLPEAAVLEVPIGHPDYRWFAELGLRWHAVPAIANMRLSIGGVNYPCAPFNGWYMGAEIGARNLADAERYNLLPVVAARLGLDTTHEASLWRDRALVELNIAVLWSFERAGVKISDHHTESRRFLTHIAREQRAGRTVPADWSWIVPPISGGTTPVFHRYYDEEDRRPAFYLDAAARELGTAGRLSPTASGPAISVCPVDHGGSSARAVPAQPRPPVRPPIPSPSWHGAGAQRAAAS